MKKIYTIIILVTMGINAWSQCIPNSNSLNFNGTASNGNIPINPLLIFTGHITVEAWINANSFTTAATIYGNSIVSKDGWGFGEQGFALRCGSTVASTTGKLSFIFAGIDTVGNYTSWKELISTSSLTTNTWYHVAGTFDGDTQRCYINGVLEASLLFKGTIRDSSAYDMKIGGFAYTGGGTRYWNGMIDEVRIWNRALSQAEIDSNMNHHIDPAVQTGLVGYWRCNEGSGATLNDMSGNNLNGSLTSIGWSTSVPFTVPTPTANLTFVGGQLTVNPPTANYQWYRNGVLLPNDSLQSWHPTQNGLYYVMVTDSSGCTGFSVALNITNVGLEELSSTGEITIRNNSFYSVAEIKLSQGLLADKMEVYDANGRMLILIDSKLKDSYTLRYDGYNSGMYLLRISTNKGVFVRKLSVL